jgi:hypothetical protein
MDLFDYLLLLSGAAFVTSSSYYFKERKTLYEFSRQSRRHHSNKAIEISMRQKSTRYFRLSAVLFFATIAFAFLSLK